MTANVITFPSPSSELDAVWTDYISAHHEFMTLLSKGQANKINLSEAEKEVVQATRYIQSITKLAALDPVFVD